MAEEENILLKEILAKYNGENPVVIDFEALDEFSVPTRYQLLTNNHLWVSANEAMERELSLTFKNKMEVNVQKLG